MAMIFETDGFSTSTGDDECLAYVYCTDKNGYCLSLARQLEDDLVEVMVNDQINHKTREIVVELKSNELRVSLSPGAALCLDRVAEYRVSLKVDSSELQELDAALTVIFEGGNRGRYVRFF